MTKDPVRSEKVKPACPIFGQCGGCAYQDISYEEELRLKESFLRELFARELSILPETIESIVASPEPYHYRSRLDLGVRRTKKGEFFMGFMPQYSRRIVPADSCAIARKEISDFLPELRRQAQAKLPEDYRVANLVVRAGEDGRVFWGGIGRRSLEMNERDYFWTEIHGKKIFYSLDTFFQANLSVLPLLMEKIGSIAGFDQNTFLFDLYSGVGLFGICFADKVKKVFMIEESKASVKAAQFNVRFHGLASKVETVESKVEDYLYKNFTHPPLPSFSHKEKGAGKRGSRCVAIVDPPRRGLHAGALNALTNFPGDLLYLSCMPESLVRDLKVFVEKGWTIEKVIPFDFFPKTVHLETLVKLVR